MPALHFLPYFRTGMASQITAVAVDGLSSGEAATARLSVTVSARSTAGDTESVTLGARNVELRGPGSITAIHNSEIIRRYPEPGASDPELNYFCLVEFAEPDFPWRYTPAKPDANDRLQPWLALVVVADAACSVAAGNSGLDVLTVPGTALPPPADVWAWAHVQVDSDDATVDAAAMYATEPSSLRSRLLCPTRLLRNTAYTAYVVPTFEAGRLAGLGVPNSNVAGPAWTATPDNVQLPIYSSWSFSTSEPGDFESLVRRLTARELPPTVGIRDLDVGAAGSGMPQLPGSVVTFQGALVSPAAPLQSWPDDERRPLQNSLLTVLRDDVDPPADPNDYDPLVHDPVVRPALYGSLQARVSALQPGPVDGSRRVRPSPGGVAQAAPTLPGQGRPNPTESGGRGVAPQAPGRHPDPVWMDQLNLDPTTRTVAGVGSSVVRLDQEHLMDAAWQAAKGLNDVNRRLNASALATKAAGKLEGRISELPPERLVQFLGPSLARLHIAGGTQLRELRRSDLPNVVSAGAYRRIGRPNGLLSRRLRIVDPATAVNTRYVKRPDGPIVAHRRTAVPAGCDVPSQEIGPDESGADLRSQIDFDIAKFIDPVRVGERGVPRLLAKPNERLRPYDTIVPAGRGGRVIERDGLSSVVRELHVPLRPRGPAPRSVAVDITKRLLDATSHLIETHGPIQQRAQRAISAPGEISLNPLPPRVWATPSFPIPIYERVRALGVEYLVPGAGDIPDETVGLLETNDRYVESVMAGANHEMSREFLWREYPAQLHRTWFQQFWNAPKVDISPIDTWDRSADLGAQDGSAEADLVLVIKGTFPKRYPDVQIWAQRAAWVYDEHAERWLRDLQHGGERRSPVLAGELQPGVVFYGFALRQTEANGGSLAKLDRNVLASATAANPPGGLPDPGWFFVLQERPQGIRFGLDAISRTNGVIDGIGAAPESWADLNWANVATAGQDDPPVAVDIGATPWLERIDDDDVWGDDAAAQARITLQRPVQVKVHASAMLAAPETT